MARTKIRKCTYCNEPFEYDSSVGRPPAFCPKCLEVDKGPWRYCILDNRRFQITDPEARKPYFCSAKCQEDYKYFKRCYQCGLNPALPDSPFCSEKCWKRYVETTEVYCGYSKCGNTVKAKPMRLCQHFCSERHSNLHYEEITGRGSNRWNRSGNRQLHLDLTRRARGSYVDLPPRMKSNRPWTCPAPVGGYLLAPLTEQSIKFHRDVMWPKLIEDPAAFILFFIVYGGFNQDPRNPMYPMWDTLPWCWDLVGQYQESLKMCLDLYQPPAAKWDPKPVRMFEHLVLKANMLNATVYSGSPNQALLEEWCDPKNDPNYIEAVRDYTRYRKEMPHLPNPDLGLDDKNKIHMLLPYHSKMMRYFLKYQTTLSYSQYADCPSASAVQFDGWDTNSKDYVHARGLRDFMEVQWQAWCETHNIELRPQTEAGRNEELVLTWANTRLIRGKLHPSPIPSKTSGAKSGRRKP